MSIIIVPGVLVEPLREGAYAVSRDVAEAIDQGEDLGDCRERLAGVCRLLDAIGWTKDDPAVDTEIDLDVHAATLRPVVATMEPALREADGEHESYEALREFASELPELPHRIEIPAEIVLFLRSALYAEVSRTAADLEAECSLREPEDCAAKLAQFDRARALLDVVGWSEPEHQQPLSVDFGLYGQTVREVIETDLETQRDLAKTHDLPQREHATTTAALLEGFLVGLEAT